MFDAYVSGNGIAELAAALELAEVGLRVRVGAAPGGSAALAAADDLGVPDPDGAVRGWLQHVAAPISEDAAGGAGAAAGAPAGAGSPPSAALVSPVTEGPSRAVLRSVTGDWRAAPQPNVWGIPAVPMSSDSMALLGGRASLRATVDRIRPVLTIGKTEELGTLVRSRMGQQALERLVEPLVRERFGVGGAKVDVAIAAPGLNEALTTAGSLSGAVLIQEEAQLARETLVRPAGGWAALREAVLDRLALYNVTFGGEVAEISELPEPEGQSGGSISAAAARPRWTVRETSGEEFAVAALVIGLGADLPQHTQQPLFAPAAQFWRARGVATVGGDAVPADLVAAVAEIDTAAGPTAASAETSGGTQAGQLAAVEALAGMEGWAVKYDRLDGGRWRVTVAGPAVGSAEVSLDATARLSQEAWTTALLTPEAAAAGVRWQVAPFTSTATRDAAEAELSEERELDSSVARVGRGLHGGDLGAAIADARAVSVKMRRRLTGIID